MLHSRPEATVGAAIKSGRLIAEPRQRPRYTLDELLSHCNPKIARSKEEREWFDTKPTGGELI